METMRNYQKQQFKRLISEFMKKNNYSFSQFKKEFFNCLVRMNVITIISTPPLPTYASTPITTTEQEEDEEPSVFEEYGVEEEVVDTEQYLEPQQFRQGVKQWEQMSTIGGSSIEGEGKEIEKLKKGILYTTTKSAIERALQDGVAKIKEVGDSYGLNPQIINTAVKIWENVVSKFNDENFQRRRVKREWVVFSFLYTVNELYDLQYSAGDVFSRFEVTPSKNYSKWIAQNKDILPEKEIKDIIFCNFELTPQNKKELYDYVKQIEDEEILTSNISPRNNIRAKTSLMYWYLKDKLGTRVTKKSVQESCGASVNTDFYNAIKTRLS